MSIMSLGEGTTTVTTEESTTHPPLLLRSQQQDQSDGQLQISTVPDRQHVIHWAPGTVDNEFMGKKKSKCCCIYTKPRNWDDPSSSSSSDDDDDDINPRKCTEHCRGHTKHCFTKKSAAQQKEMQASTSETIQQEQQPSQPPSLPLGDDKKSS